MWRLIMSGRYFWKSLWQYLDMAYASDIGMHPKHIRKNHVLKINQILSMRLSNPNTKTGTSWNPLSSTATAYSHALFWQSLMSSSYFPHTTPEPSRTVGSSACHSLLRFLPWKDCSFFSIGFILLNYLSTNRGSLCPISDLLPLLVAFDFPN